jgi:hypothetical protein
MKRRLVIILILSILLIENQSLEEEIVMYLIDCK